MGEREKKRNKPPQAPYCLEVNVFEMSAQAMEASFECVSPGFVLVESVFTGFPLLKADRPSFKPLHLPPNPSRYVSECLKF